MEGILIMYIEPRLPDHTDIWTANLNSRIVHCFGEIEENMAESIIAQLLYLDAQSHDDIQFYINSYGGDVKTTSKDFNFYCGRFTHNSLRHF